MRRVEMGAEKREEGMEMKRVRWEYMSGEWV
jgi:hypothetical protein